MKKLALAAALLGLLCQAAHGQKTKAALNAEINAQFPDNQLGLITPQVLRGVTMDMINSIMPTAPVGSGNLAIFDGTTGLLKDGGGVPGAGAVTYVQCGGGDDTAVIQAAVTAGKPVVLPAATCVIKTSITYSATGSALMQGPQISGQGMQKTILDFQGASSCMFAFQSGLNGQYVQGITLSGFKVTNSNATSGACGISIYRAANVSIQNIQMTGLSGNGIQGTATAGDPDASFVIGIQNVRMDNVGTGANGWCVQFNAPSGGYFASNMRFTNFSCNGSGQAGSNAVPPTSGGVELKGLIAQFENSAFTANNGPDLYIQGPDSTFQVTIDGVDFENNVSTTLPHIYVDGGLRGFILQNSECLNNDSFISQGCLWINSASGPIGNVLVDKMEVRATSGNNTYTAFKTSGSNTLVDTVRIGDIYWQTFDASGQTRFIGFNFTPIPGQVRLYVASTNTIGLTTVGYGAALPIKLAATGEWVPAQLTTGITTALGPLSASTTYNLYAYNSASTNAPYVVALEANATSTSVDVPGGYLVKSTDSTRTFVGTITTDGSGNFTTSSAIASWYAPIAVPLTRTITGGGLVSGGGDLTANRTLTVTAAAKSDMQAPSSSTIAVTPAQTQNHPGVAKFFARFDGKTSATCTLKDSYNVASCTRNGTGDYTLTYTTAFADANYALTGTAYNTGTSIGFVGVSNIANVTTTTVRFLCLNTSALAQDCDFVSVAGYGPQ